MPTITLQPSSHPQLAIANYEYASPTEGRVGRKLTEVTLGIMQHWLATRLGNELILLSEERGLRNQFSSYLPIPPHSSYSITVSFDRGQNAEPLPYPWPK